MTTFVDTHCHLDFDVFENDLAEVIARSQAANIGFMINPGINLPSSKAAVHLTESYPGKIYAGIGFHPNYSVEWDENSHDSLLRLAKNRQVVAIGEIGLDYYRDYTPLALQQEVFLAQLELAKDINLPILIHNRDADDDLIPFLSDWYQGLPATSRLKAHPGVLHSYDSNLKIAEKIMAMNFMIGITGPVTFKNANERKALVTALPLDYLLLETDAPFLTPHPHRGRRNLPEYIPLIAAEIARLKNRDIEEVAAITTQNARSLFGI